LHVSLAAIAAVRIVKSMEYTSYIYALSVRCAYGTYLDLKPVNRGMIEVVTDKRHVVILSRDIPTMTGPSTLRGRDVSNTEGGQKYLQNVYWETSEGTWTYSLSPLTVLERRGKCKCHMREQQQCILVYRVSLGINSDCFCKGR
jgi:hypothetical protein